MENEIAEQILSNQKEQTLLLKQILAEVRKSNQPIVTGILATSKTFSDNHENLDSKLQYARENSFRVSMTDAAEQERLAREFSARVAEQLSEISKAVEIFHRTNNQ